MELGEKIRVLRKGRYTQEELADKIGVHINTLVRWEKGYRYPTADKLKILADALDTTTDFLTNSEAVLLEEGSEDLSFQYTIPSLDSEPPAKERSVIEKNRGRLVYRFKDGEELELPDTERGYKLFERIFNQKAMQVAV